MAISSFQRPSSSNRVGVTVNQTSGAFDIDVSEGTDFYLNFDEAALGSTLVEPVFVGGASKGDNSGSSISFNFANDIGGALQQNDLVVIALAYSDSGTQTLAMSTSGYTQIVSLFANDTTDTGLAVFYKVMGSVPDTGVVTASSSADVITAAVHVWRNIDASNPIDVTPTTSIQSNSQIPNPPAITTSTDNALVLFVGAAAIDDADAPLAMYSPSGSDEISIEQIGTRASSLLIASAGLFTNSGESGDPSQPFLDNLGGNVITEASNASATIAIRTITQSNVIDTVDINFSNIPSEIKDISLFGVLPSTITNVLNNDTLNINWDSSLVQITTLGSQLLLGEAISEELFSYGSTVYSNTNQKNTESSVSKIQKTEFIKSTTSWTAPSDVSEVEILICGGGGSGNDSGTNAGGGGGSAFEDVLKVIPGQSYTIAIGAGGPSAGTSTTGNDGSPSSFGSLFVAAGGGGARVSLGGVPAGLGGVGASYSATSPDSFSSHGEGLKGYGRGGMSEANLAGAVNSGQGGSSNTGGGEAGGSGICIIKYWTAT